MRIVLAEKELIWEDRLIDLLAGIQHRPQYLEINPNGTVPTLIDKQVTLTESSLINEYLDEQYVERGLMPVEALDRYQVRAWIRWVEEHVHPACGVLSYAIAARPLLLERPYKDVLSGLNNLNDRQTATRRKNVLDKGIQAEEVVEAVLAYAELLRRAEAALERSPWLAGNTYSLAEASIFPYVLRLAQLGLDTVLAVKRYPRIADWIMRNSQRVSHKIAYERYLSSVAIDTMAIYQAGRSAWPVIVERLPPDYSF